MSSAGQAAGGIVGAVAGFFVGGPTGALYGAQIGMTVGSIIDPPKGPDVKGPRLDDLTVQTSTYGAVIPRIYGTLAVTGNVFWLENNAIREKVTDTSRGGKGGGSTSTSTTYSYYATFAVGLCDCPGAPIAGVRRIWIAGRLWYDAGASDVDSIAVSNAANEYFTLYPGSDTQLPDDRMQATLGVANTPAYRGLAYIVFKDLPLAEYSNSLMGAQIRVEVVASGAVVRYKETPVSIPYEYWGDMEWNGKIFCAITTVPYPAPYCATSRDGVTWAIHPLPVLFSYDSIAWNGKVFCIIGHDGRSLVSPNGISWSIGTMPWGAVTDWTGISCKGRMFVAFGYLKTAYSMDGLSWSSGTLFSATISVARSLWNGSVYVAAVIAKSYVLTSSDGIFWTQSPVPVSGIWSDIAWNGSVFCIVAGNSEVCLTSPDGQVWTIRNLPTSRTQNSITACGPDFAVMGMSDWNLYVSSDNGVSWLTYRIVAGGLLASAWDGAHLCLVPFGGATAQLVTPYQIESSSPTLASIITSEVEQSKILTAADIDTSALTQTVRGYRISGVAALRSGIDPLQGTFPFDVVQRGYVIKFKPRGSASVATIPAADLDARSAGDSPGVSITTAREMDSVLPQRVRVSFMDFDREYDVNEQSDERLNADSVNVTSIDLAIVLTCAEAQGIAQVLLYLYWMERYDLTFKLPPTYARLEPGDVVTVQASEGTYSLRLTAITYTQDGRLECIAKYNSTAIYTPTALGVPSIVTPTALARVSDSLLVLLDIPVLLDSMDQPGYLAAMTGYSPEWPAGVIYRSDGIGQEPSLVTAMLAPGSPMGFASNVMDVPLARTDVFEHRGVLSVAMVHGEFFSVSEISVLNGSNWFAYGVDGRWEIIAAKTCTIDLAENVPTYSVSDMLRGRNGTEWAINLHQVGDLVILLDPSHIDYLSASIDKIGRSFSFWAVTPGQPLKAASVVDFTYAGVNFECLSPVYLNGNRSPSIGDWTLTWIRRTRVGGEWRDNVDALLSETVEAYEVEIYSSSGYSVLKRTITGLSSATAVYSSVNQVADFGANQATLYVKIYQLSATVGRGTPLITNITR